MFHDGINWEIPPKKGWMAQKFVDCGVSVVKSGNSRQVTFTFYNKIADRIVGNSEYMIYGLDSDNSRVYFAKAAEKKGFKISSDSVTRRCIRRTIRQEDYDMWDSWKGGYYLRHDNRRGYYYIDKSEKMD